MCLEKLHVVACEVEAPCSAPPSIYTAARSSSGELLGLILRDIAAGANARRSVHGCSFIVYLITTPLGWAFAMQSGMPMRDWPCGKSL